MKIYNYLYPIKCNEMKYYKERCDKYIYFLIKREEKKLHKIRFV